MKHRIKAAVTAAALVVVASVVPMTTATPASATTSGCTKLLTVWDTPSGSGVNAFASNICSGYDGHFDIDFYYGGVNARTSRTSNSNHNPIQTYNIFASNGGYPGSYIYRVCASGWRYDGGGNYTHMGTACDDWP
jgi:hypothetical protein